MPKRTNCLRATTASHSWCRKRSEDGSGTGVSPVCRLHDSHGRDARTTHYLGTYQVFNLPPASNVLPITNRRLSFRRGQYFFCREPASESRSIQGRMTLLSSRPALLLTTTLVFSTAALIASSTDRTRLSPQTA